MLTTAPTSEAPTNRGACLDQESQAWMDRLTPHSSQRKAALAALQAHLLEAARFEVARRRAGFPHLRGDGFDDLARQSADDALGSVLDKLDDFRGDSRFTTTRSDRCSAPTSAGSSSRSRSATSRSTSSPSGSTPPAARATRPSTTLDTSSDVR
jgi:hypothetical protein